MIIRYPERRRWTVIDRDAVNDSRLSYRARGILVWLLDKPDGWDSRSDGIATNGTEGRDAVRASLRELEEFGYLVREKRQLKSGRWQTETWIYERPKTDFQASENPTPGNPDVGGPGAKNQVLTSNTDLRTIQFDEISAVPECPRCLLSTLACVCPALEEKAG